MRKYIVTLLLVLVAGCGAFYLSDYLEFLYADLLSTTTTITVTATVAPDVVVVVADDDSSQGSSAVAVAAVNDAKSVVVNPTVKKSVLEKAPPPQPIDAVPKTGVVPKTDVTTIPSTPKNVESKKVDLIPVKPVVEIKPVVVETNKDIVLEKKTLAPYVAPDVIAPYLDVFTPNITRIESIGTKPSGGQPSSVVLNNIVALNVDRVIAGKDTVELHANKPIIFKGKTEPFAKVVITLQSRLQKAIVFADKNGDWFWSPPKLVDPGDHTFSAVISNQATNQVIEEKRVIVIVKAPLEAPNGTTPFYISITPGYQVVSGDKPFGYEINFPQDNKDVVYPIKLDYQIYDDAGSLFGKGSLLADPAEGSVVRLALELKGGTNAGIYRVHINTTELDSVVEADALFKVSTDIEAEIIATDKKITQTNSNALIFSGAIVTFLFAMGIYLWRRK